MAETHQNLRTRSLAGGRTAKAAPERASGKDEVKSDDGRSPLSRLIISPVSPTMPLWIRIGALLLTLGLVIFMALSTLQLGNSLSAGKDAEGQALLTAARLDAARLDGRLGTARLALEAATISPSGLTSALKPPLSSGGGSRPSSSRATRSGAPPAPFSTA